MDTSPEIVELLTNIFVCLVLLVLAAFAHIGAKL